MTYNKFTTKIDGGEGSFIFNIENPTGEFTLEVGLEVMAQDKLTFTIDGEIILILNQDDLLYN